MRSFGPKNFIIISDPGYAKQILSTNADKYSKGILRCVCMCFCVRVCGLLLFSSTNTAIQISQIVELFLK
jgi:hypothetical protein